MAGGQVDEADFRQVGHLGEHRGAGVGQFTHLRTADRAADQGGGHQQPGVVDEFDGLAQHRAKLGHGALAKPLQNLVAQPVETDLFAEFVEGRQRQFAQIGRGVGGEGAARLFQKPIGVVPGICPWNFPFFLMARKVAPSLLDAMVQRAVAAGAEVVTGGKPAEVGTGYFYEPTLISGATQDSEIVQKEVFGPVLPIVKWDDYDQVITDANDCEYGLTSSIFTTNVNTVMQAIKDLNFGETYVNREHFEGIQGFHAGWRKSGIGGADGKHGLYEYLQSQVVYIRY